MTNEGKTVGAGSSFDLAPFDLTQGLLAQSNGQDGEPVEPRAYPDFFQYE